MKCVSLNCNCSFEDKNIKGRDGKIYPRIFCDKHSLRHASVDYLCDICHKEIKQRNDVFASNYKKGLVYCAQCSKKISKYLLDKNFNKAFYSNSEFRRKFLENINVDWVYENGFRDCAVYVALLNSEILFKSSAVYNRDLALLAFKEDYKTAPKRVYNKLISIDEEFKTKQIQQREKSFNTRLSNGSWKKCMIEGSTKEAHRKQENTKIKNGTCNVLKPEIVESNRNKTVRNRKWLEKYAIPNIAEIIYTRDENDNITHIDGVPIEDKYEAIATDILDIKNSLIVSTGRDQNSTSWVGKEAFDQFLINQGIGWFVYIKYDILNNPLVVGKTGTRMVSNSVNDISFDYWESNKGPARQYLKDNNLDWDKTKVLIVPCNTEQEALDKEKEIHDRYSLFYS